MIHLPTAHLQDCSAVGIVQTAPVAACSHELDVEQKGRVWK